MTYNLCPDLQTITQNDENPRGTDENGGGIKKKTFFSNSISHQDYKTRLEDGN